MKPFKQVTILGVGLIGGSLALALKVRGLALRIVGVGHREASIEKALDCGAIDQGTLSADEGVSGSDMVVLATPVSLFAPLMQQAAYALAPGTIVIDVGSVKRSVIRDVVPLVPAGCHFVPCHPLAGSECRGIDAARADLLEGAVCVITPTEETDAESLRRVTEMWQAVGMKVAKLTPESHDRLIAGASHLPHVVASALVHALADDAEHLAATGFADTTRVAGGAPGLWCDILLANADEVLDSIASFSGVLSKFCDALKARDGDTLKTLLTEARARRNNIVKRNNKTDR
ncbi:MAG: prephenate dehydrogenase/arogenate dehydrogenase family protein [Planctomycetia bacterium]|nr:prephenate dehydrogenase/arogenate dehydrogenase family protein [Planctomycetia bacterium]